MTAAQPPRRAELQVESARDLDDDVENVHFNREDV